MQIKTRFSKLLSESLLDDIVIEDMNTFRDRELGEGWMHKIQILNF